eukprot:TRINITY_DN7664_c0_g1_i2.p1 TRINITY_DN7664_c0_g1~~TRINITY_DN7664_c0_g1_i2.p1  ORF type:complete len:268 (+),score=-21.33 TRINITY_DN7664_c0_g1_i2:63-866(+)
MVCYIQKITHTHTLSLFLTNNQTFRTFFQPNIFHIAICQNSLIKILTYSPSYIIFNFKTKIQILHRHMDQSELNVKIGITPHKAKECDLTTMYQLFIQIRNLLCVFFIYFSVVVIIQFFYSSCNLVQLKFKNQRYIIHVQGYFFSPHKFQKSNIKNLFLFNSQHYQKSKLQKYILVKNIIQQLTLNSLSLSLKKFLLPYNFQKKLDLKKKLLTNKFLIRGYLYIYILLYIIQAWWCSKKQWVLLILYCILLYMQIYLFCFISQIQIQ